jgi:dolichyl-phosphate beta-glucosyltransferase
LFVPKPRAVKLSEKKYRRVSHNNSVSKPLPLPSWYNYWSAVKKNWKKAGEPNPTPAELLVSVIVPAYNEGKRIWPMLDDAIDFLDLNYSHEALYGKAGPNAHLRRRVKSQAKVRGLEGWELNIVSDGSTDDTVSKVFQFARENVINRENFRVIELEENRGKGGAVVHGLKHVRGKYVLFADADGATDFKDLGEMIKVADAIAKTDPEGKGRAVVIGSRAHMVGTEAVVKVCVPSVSICII